MTDRKMTKRKMWIIAIILNIIASVILYFFNFSWDMILILFFTGIFASWTSMALIGDSATKK